MNTRLSLTVALAAGAALLSVLPSQQALAGEALTARSAMVAITGPSKINQVYDTYDRACVAWLTPQGNIASEAVFYRDRVSGRRLPPLFMYGFAMNHPDYPNGTIVEGLTVIVTGKSTVGPIEPVIQNEEEGLIVELPDENVEIDFKYWGANGANGSVGLLTSSGLTYNARCNQENRAGKPPGVSVNAIQGPDSTVGSCASSGAARDSALSNDGKGGDLVTYAGSPIRLEPGTYNLSVTGTIKSPNGGADLSIAANKAITVVKGCSPE